MSYVTLKYIKYYNQTNSRDCRTEYIHSFNFNWIPQRVPEIKGFDKQTVGRTDRQQSDAIMVLFLFFEVRNPKIKMFKSQENEI